MTSPRCPSHQQAAVATCARCGTFLCGECIELRGEDAWCASCVALVGSRSGSRWRRLLPRAALVLLGLFLLSLAWGGLLLLRLQPG